MDWYEKQTRNYPGEFATIDGQQFVLCKFRCGNYKEAMPAYAQFEAAQKASDPAGLMAAEMQIVLAALHQNYPAMTMADLDEHLSPEELIAVLQTINAVNRGTEAGEAQAGAPPTPAIQ